MTAKVCWKSLDCSKTAQPESLSLPFKFYIVLQNALGEYLRAIVHSYQTMIEKHLAWK